MVIDKSTGNPIGWCGLKNNPWGTILDSVFEAVWGQGIATERANTVEKAKALGLSSLIGRALSKILSWKVLEKVGMQRYESLPIEEFAQTTILLKKTS